jgi:P pilus assembly chaperone PapD
MSNKHSLVFRLFLIIFIILPLNANAVGELLVSPTRIILEGRERSAEVKLANKSNKAATYRLSFQDLSMEENGGYKELSENEGYEKTASNMIRFSPRQVTLKPGEVQSVRLMVRKPKELDDGEYRTHLFFKAIPSEKDSRYHIENQKSGGKNLSVKLIPIFGVSIPVIVKHGELEANVAIENAHIAKDKRNISFSLKRDGMASRYGNLNIIHQKPTGESELLKEIRGIGVLYPLNKRNIEIALNKKIDSGKLRIEYRDVEDEDLILAKEEISL